jgi:hypothetical protein
MTFKVTQATVDVINKTASVVALDEPWEGELRLIQVSFPFDLPAEAAEKVRVIDAAKQILQQALRDI